MYAENVLTAKDTIDIIIPVVVAIITWFLARIKNPDYGKRDWKCRKRMNPFGAYTVFLIVVFILPSLAYIFTMVLQKIYIEPILGLLIAKMEIPDIAIRIYFVIATITIYYFVCKVTKYIKILFVPKKIETITLRILKVIIYCPIILNFAVSMRISTTMDMSHYSNGITVFILVFQIAGMAILDDEKSYLNKKMTIYMRDGDKIIANVDDVYKKGKWLRIVEQRIPGKEKLIVFEDIKSIEYYD